MLQIWAPNISGPDNLFCCKYSEQLRNNIFSVSCLMCNHMADWSEIRLCIPIHVGVKNYNGEFNPACQEVNISCGMLLYLFPSLILQREL